MTREARRVTPTRPPDRLMTAVGWAAPAQVDTSCHPLRSVPLSEPVRLETVLREQLAGHARQALVAGPLAGVWSLSNASTVPGWSRTCRAAPTTPARGLIGLPLGGT